MGAIPLLDPGTYGDSTGEPGIVLCGEMQVCFTLKLQK